MCRLLLVKSENEFEIKDYLERFASISKNSPEFQGHGWGLAYCSTNKWCFYKDIKPIWKDDLSRFGTATLLVVHARSAFKDEGIVVENNMPFYDKRFIFIFNGELQGVKIKQEGRIGAEKIFNFIKRQYNSNLKSALKDAVKTISKRTRYIKAMNIIIVDRKTKQVCASTLFNEREKYFTLHFKSEDKLMICSKEFDDTWRRLENGTVRCFE